MNIKKNDTVVVLSGKDKGKKGKVLKSSLAAFSSSLWRANSLITSFFLVHI